MPTAQLASAILSLLTSLSAQSEAGFIASGSAPAPRQAPQPAPDLTATLRSAPELLEGRLANGTRFAVLRHPAHGGNAQLWLHVGAGCLNDPDGRHGLAHFVEHMAFQGSENIEPAAVGPFLESLGIVPARHALSTTGYDRTTFELTLPDNDPATFDTALLFLADVAGRLTFPAEGIEQERQVLIDERRVGLSASTRIADATLPTLAPGSLLAMRTIVGRSKDIASVTREDLAQFHQQWYAPENLTVIAVADADPKMVAARIEAAFGPLAARPVPPAPDPGVPVPSGVNAAVALDREAGGATVTIARVLPARPPVTTVGQWRRQLAERVALRAFNQRLDEQIALGRARIRSAEARAGQLGRAAFRTEIEASGAGGEWPAMLDDLRAELRRALEGGFDSAEIARARESMLAVARRSAETAALRPTAQVVRLIDGAVGAGEPYLSPAQELDLGEALLPGLTDDEINARLAELFDPDNAGYVLVLPASAEPVTEEQFIAAVTGKAVAATARPSGDRALLDSVPAEGEIASSQRHVGSSVLTLRMDNNVTAHYRLMEHRHELVTLTVLFPGGELLETDATRGLTRAASEVFRTPVTRSRSADELAALTLDRGIVIAPTVSPDDFGFEITTPPEHAETAFQLAHALITDAALTDEAVERWKARHARAMTAMRSDPAGVFAALLPDALYPPDEARTRPPTVDHARAVTPAAAREWLERAAAGPIEVSIVGNIDEDRALSLARRYFGSLPDRPAVESARHAERRSLPRPEGDRVVERTVPGAEATARLIVGFFGPDADARRDARLLSLGARIVEARVRTSLQETGGPGASVAVSVSPATAYPGYGLVFAAATSKPGNAAPLADAIEKTMSEFAAGGPTAEELKAARRAANDEQSTMLLEPRYWTEQLRALEYRATSLDEIVDAPAEFASYTAEEVRDCFARYHGAGPAIRVVVTAEPAPRPTE